MIDAEKVKEAYKNMLCSPNGDVVLHDLLLTYVLAGNPYKEPMMAMRFEGRRDLVLALVNMAYGDPDHAIDILIKHKKEETDD